MKTNTIIVISLFLFKFCLYSQLPKNGLIGYWPFSGNAFDTVGNNHGIINNATLCVDRFGKQNQAYYFDGDDNISLLFNNKIDINMNSTIMFWFKAESNQNSYAKLLCVPYSLDTWNNPYHYLAISKNSGFVYANFGNGLCETPPFTQDGDTAWTLITLTYKEGDINIYTNGILTQTLYCTNTLMPLNGTMSIGSRSTKASNNGEYFKGYFDELSIYNRALTQEEITAYYNNICSTVYVDKISTYYVSDSNFNVVNNTMYLDSILKITNNGCDSIVRFYSKFIYKENFFTDTIIRIDTITITDTIMIMDTVTYRDTITYRDSIKVTDTLIIDVTITSINQNKSVNSIKVYPNPTNDIVFINISKENDEISDYSINITSSNGATVFKSKLTESLFKINVSDFGKTGLYNIQIIDNKGNTVETRKLILN